MLKLPPLLLRLPCSAAETTALWLWTSLPHKLLRKLNFSFLPKMEIFICENILFFILLQLGTFLASCWPVVLFAVVNHIYPTTTSQYSVIHHMFFVQSCTRRICSLSQSKFPITICGSFSSWVIASLLWNNFFQPPKCLKVPLHPPTHLHIFLSINEITSGIHITGLSQKGFLWPQLYFTSSLYIDHPPSVVIFHDIHWHLPTPFTLSSLDTTTHRTIACITMNWKVLRFSYNCHQRWFVCVKHSLMWGSDPRTSVQTPSNGL